MQSPLWIEFIVSETWYTMLAHKTLFIIVLFQY